MDNCSNAEMLKTSSELPGKYCGWLEYSDIDDDNNDININRHLWLLVRGDQSNYS